MPGVGGCPWLVLLIVPVPFLVCAQSPCMLSVPSVRGDPQSNDGKHFAPLDKIADRGTAIVRIDAEGQYVASPSIVKLDSGRLLVVVERYGTVVDGWMERREMKAGMGSSGTLQGCNASQPRGERHGCVTLVAGVGFFWCAVVGLWGVVMVWLR